LKTQEKKYHNFSGEDLNILLKSAVNGNLQSFDELSKQLRSISYSYFLSKYKSGKMKNREDADDLANNVFITFARQYRKIENIENWLRRVLFLTFVNWYKKQKAHPSFELKEELANNEAIPNFGETVDLQKILLIIAGLKDNKQSIIKMRFWEGLKFQEIAEKLNKNEAAIKKTFYRTIEEIKKKLE